MSLHLPAWAAWIWSALVRAFDTDRDRGKGEPAECPKCGRVRCDVEHGECNPCAGRAW